MRITGITLDEIDQIAELWRHLEDMHIVFDAELGKDRRYRKWDERKTEMIALSSHEYLLQVLQDDSIHGYCLSTLTADGLGDIESVFVSDENRGQGWGLQLLRNSLAWFEEYDTREVRLLVHPKNPRAIKVYRHLGFTEDDDPPTQSACRSCDAISTCLAFRLKQPVQRHTRPNISY